MVRPLRAAAAGKLVLTVAGSGVNFSNRRLNFCFDVEGAGAARHAVVAQDAKLISQMGDVARFEVRVPKDVESLWKTEAARTHLAGWMPAVGLPSVVRVLGYDKETMVIDAAGPVTLSDARIAITIGMAMLLVLFFASAIWLHQLNL